MTTYFVGSHYEVTGSTVTKYYFAGASRIAMRTGSTLSYLLTDHLGSTSITTNSAGALVSELRYKPWGEVRYSNGTASTKYTFTGQFSNTSEFGLMYYGARWYDPALSRFTQADSIVPGGVQGYDRYAYVNNSPVNFADPSGHKPCWARNKYDCTASEIAYGAAHYGGGGNGGGSSGCNTLTCMTGSLGFGGGAILVDGGGSGWPIPLGDGKGIFSDWPISLSLPGVDDMFGDWQAGRYSGCFMCHVAVANGQIMATNDQLATAHENMKTWQAIGYTPMVVPAVSVFVVSAAEPVFGIYAFGHTGAGWHLGLETANEMSIVHIGNHVEWGFHIAFGSVAPRVADLHIYLQSTFPFYRIWRP